MQAEQKCNTVHNLSALSFTTASIACFLAITTIAMNGLMLHLILKGQRNRPKSSGVVSIALVNTVIADLLTGLFTDIVVTISHIMEGLRTGDRKDIIKTGHVVHFLTTGAALFSVTLLSLDRIAAFMWPLKYKKSLIRPKIRTWHMFLAVWSASAMFVILYFQLGFIKYLAVYAGVNISIPAVLMILTIIVYRKKFGAKTITTSHPSVWSNSPHSPKLPNSRDAKTKILNKDIPTVLEPTMNGRDRDGSFNSSNSRTDEDPYVADKKPTVRFDTGGQTVTVDDFEKKGAGNQLGVPEEVLNDSYSGRSRGDSFDDGFDSTYSAAGSTTPTATIRRRKRRTDKRLLRALIINFGVFIFTYLPTAIFITYLNACVDCNCEAVHVLRDAIGLFVRLASLLRPITFAVCTTSLRDGFRKLLPCEC